MRQHRITRSAALGLALAALAALAAPTALARPMLEQDLRSSDNRDTAAAPARSVSHHHLRSPDADAAANGRGTFSAPAETVVKVSEPSVAASPPSGAGIDLSDVGIGAGGMLALVVLAASGAIAVLHRRQDEPTRSRATPTV